MAAGTGADAATSWHKSESNGLLASSDGTFGAKGLGIKAGLAGGLLLPQILFRKHKDLRTAFTVGNFAQAGHIYRNRHSQSRASPPPQAWPLKNPVNRPSKRFHFGRGINGLLSAALHARPLMILCFCLAYLTNAMLPSLAFSCKRPRKVVIPPSGRPGHHRAVLRDGAGNRLLPEALHQDRRGFLPGRPGDDRLGRGAQLPCRQSRLARADGLGRHRPINTEFWPRTGIGSAPFPPCSFWAW